MNTVEAKINPDAFNDTSLAVFRERYPHGCNYLVCPFVKEPYTLRKGKFTLRICDTRHLNAAQEFLARDR